MNIQVRPFAFRAGRHVPRKSPSDGRRAPVQQRPRHTVAAIQEAAIRILVKGGETRGITVRPSAIGTLSVLERHPLVLGRLDGVRGSSVRGRLADARRLGQEVVGSFLTAHPEELRVASLPLAARVRVDFAGGLAYNLRGDDVVEVLGAAATRLMACLGLSPSRSGPPVAVHAPGGEGLGAWARGPARSGSAGPGGAQTSLARSRPASARGRCASWRWRPRRRRSCSRPGA